MEQSLQLTLGWRPLPLLDDIIRFYPAANKQKFLFQKKIMLETYYHYSEASAVLFDDIVCFDTMSDFRDEMQKNVNSRTSLAFAFLSSFKAAP